MAEFSEPPRQAPNAADFGTAGAISCSGVAQAKWFFTSFLAQHRTARAVPLPKSAQHRTPLAVPLPKSAALV